MRLLGLHFTSSLIFLCLVSGCKTDSTDDETGAGGCPSAAFDLYVKVEESVHELVACGGLQVGLSQQMLQMIVTSNTDLYDPEVAEVIEGAFDQPFELETDGRWTMEIDGNMGSTFVLRFFEPGTDTVITEDIFKIESYLVGLRADSSLSGEEMLLDPTRKSTFTYTWDSEGPLAWLLNDGEQLPEAIELRLSAQDLAGPALTAALGPLGGLLGGDSELPDFGAFDSILQMDSSSRVSVSEERDGAEITYVVDTVPVTVDEVALSGTLDFEVQSIDGSEDDVSFSGDATELYFAGDGELGGTIDYTFSGDDFEVEVVADFGEGAGYPEARWSCD